MIRVGIGFDVHAFGGPGPLRIGGVVVDAERGLAGTSDADVALHALSDALLGAAAVGDLGEHFPSTDPRWDGADSAVIVATVIDVLARAGFQVGNCDVTVISQSVRIAPHREAMRSAIARLVGVDVGAVSVKATTTDGLGAIGRDEGIAAMATVSIVSADPRAPRRPSSDRS